MMSIRETVIDVIVIGTIISRDATHGFEGGMSRRKISIGGFPLRRMSHVDDDILSTSHECKSKKSTSPSIAPRKPFFDARI
ncbi:hypothetical protein [Pendulispora albinea]|uniref:Uncharacterized protein n=1 Tax=Pendulispora albinea TaxID=2741071 RepID=A0ABZ2LLG5_9BACT